MKIRRSWIAIWVLAALLFSGCGGRDNQTAQPQETPGTGYILTGPGSFDSADTAVVVKINTEEKTITFLNLIVSRNYTLNYDGTTQFYDRYEQPLSLEQIKEGDIVDVTFLKSKKQLTTLMLSPGSWSNENVTRYDLNASARNVTVGEDTYRITSDTKVFSDGREMEMMDLNSTDILSFRGIDSTIYSIVVEKGHGYLRLSGDENFLGGWIEVGQTMIHQITEDMLLTVPEGSYQVLISTKGGGGTKNVVIGRNQEVTLDISDLEIEEVKYGQVLFVMKPSSATLYVDGTLVDTSQPVTLEYGIHQLISRAEGYSTMMSYLKVAEASAGIEITLDAEDKNGKNDKDSSGTVSSGDSVTSSFYKVHIDSPEGAEVYVDGNYAGIAPVSFPKTEGTHVITLRKDGSITRSYTIQVDGEDKDVSFSFAELLRSF